MEQLGELTYLITPIMTILISVQRYRERCSPVRQEGYQCQPRRRHSRLPGEMRLIAENRRRRCGELQEQDLCGGLEERSAERC